MLESKFKGIHIPSGCEVLVGDTEDTLVSTGVIPMDTTTSLDITYDKVEVQGSKKEEVISYVFNMKVNASFELYQIRTKIINELTGGIMNITNVPGTKISNHSESIKGFSYGKIIALSNQNANGSALNIVSVTASSKGALTLGTNYIVVADANGKYGVVILDKTGKPALNETITVVYDYTPASYTKAEMGDDVATINSKVIRFLKVQGDKKFQVTLFSANMDGGIKFTFPGSDSDKPASLPVEITGGLDSSRASGSQLLEIIDEIGV